MQTCQLTWKGETVNITPGFELFVKIEEKVAFSRLADAVNRARLTSSAADVPLSHVAWVLYCCLVHSGIRVRNPIEVHQSLFDGSMPDYGSVLGGLIVAYYGSSPEKTLKKSPENNQSSSRRSGKKSKKGTE